MRESRLTQGLLFVIAVGVLAHLVLALVDQPLRAETFRLDQCITDRPGERPAAYVHVIVHSVADVETP